MGRRAHKVTLDKLTFELIPKSLMARAYHRGSDPEAPSMNLVYIDCYRTIFKKKPLNGDSVTRYRDEIIENARLAECSLRLFMLSNMVAHAVAQDVLIQHTNKARAAFFSAKQLTGAGAIKRSMMYAQTCRNQFGTFALSSLSTLRKEDYEKDDMESTMLNSEVTAGTFIVSYKMTRGGAPYEALYAHEELQLNPYWLAIESSYMKYVLEPYRENKIAAPGVKNHRFDVTTAIGRLQRNPTEKTIAFSKRQKIMPEAVERVLSFFSYRPTDFLMDPSPITEPLHLWIMIARAIQHYQCHLEVIGEKSVFTARKLRQVNIET